MNRKTKKAADSLIIFAVTFIAGLLISAISFNLFDRLSINQMRILFAADILFLLGSGALAWFLFERKKNKKTKRSNEKNKYEINNKKELFHTVKNNFAA